MTKTKEDAPRKAPAKPSLAQRVAKLKPLPWNAIQEEYVAAHNALLAALKGDG